MARDRSRNWSVSSIGSLILVLSLAVGSVNGESPLLPNRPAPGALGRYVNPFIGTGGLSFLSGYTFPGATVPFGMVRLSPDTVSSRGRRGSNTSGYYYRDQKLLGFSHTRLSGTGAADGGNFLVIPGSGHQLSGVGGQGLDAAFSHKNETAFPGYYAIEFPELAIAAELTATRRVGVHRYTFSERQAPHILIDVTSALGRGVSKEGFVRILPEANEVEGSTRTFGTFSKRYGGLNVYFVARCNRRITAFGTRKDEKYTAGQATAAGEKVGADLAFDGNGRRSQVELKVALSYVSIKNARANLEAEAGNANFDSLLARAKEQWEGMLSRIRVEGGTAKEKVIFYSGLYHSLLMPTVFNDDDGEYLGFDNGVHQADGFRYYTDMSLWDTFRTTHPLFCLIAAPEQRDMLVSLVEMARQGGYLPRWPAGRGYSNSMFGTPADMVITDSYLKGIRNFDVETAYQAMRKTALGRTVNSRFSGRSGIDEYLKYHYCPADLVPQSVAKTLEYSYSDHSIASLAEALGHREDAALFRQHARSYRNLWNPQTQYFQPRDSHGSFMEFRPLLLTYLDRGGKYTKPYVEGNALQWRWAVPYDGAALVSLFGSKDDFVRELDEFFAKSTPQVGMPPNAYYWQGNQPDIYAPFLFNAADRPDLTQKWVRWILAVKYGDQENGLDGNDDGGTLSAWYVLASLGLFPTAGTDVYQVTSPLWKRADLKIGNNRLVITADPAGADSPYVQKVWLNKTLLPRRWLKHEEIARGGELRFEMGPHPAKDPPAPNSPAHN